MDEKTQKMLEEIYTMTQENHAFIKKIDRRQRWSTYWRAFLFLVAVGSALGLYYAFEPYVESFKDIYSQAEATFNSFILPAKVPAKK
jgi:hypothetical protein